MRAHFVGSPGRGAFIGHPNSRTVSVGAPLFDWATIGAIRVTDPYSPLNLSTSPTEYLTPEDGDKVAVSYDVSQLQGLTPQNYLDMVASDIASIRANDAAFWNLYGSNTIANSSGNGVDITYVDNANGAYILFMILRMV